MHRDPSRWLDKEFAARRARRLRRRIFILVAVLLIVLAIYDARAANCTVSPANTSFNFGKLAIPPGASVGTPIGSPAQVSLTVNCTALISAASTLSLNAIANLPPSSSIANALTTNLPGVAVVLSASSPSGPNGTLTPAAAGTAFTLGSTSILLGVLSASYTVNLTAQLVLASTASATGILSAPNLTLGWAQTNLLGLVVASGANIGSLGFSGTVVNSCAVNATQTVALPTVGTASFRGLGSTAGSTGFTIALRCPSGVSSSSVTFTTSNPQSGPNGVIAPTQGTGYASGVGIQVLNATRTPIQWNAAQLINAPAGGALNLQYFARYYQTASSVSAGRVAGTMTYTLSYQ